MLLFIKIDSTQPIYRRKNFDYLHEKLDF